MCFDKTLFQKLVWKWFQKSRAGAVSQLFESFPNMHKAEWMLFSSYQAYLPTPRMKASTTDKSLCAAPISY